MILKCERRFPPAEVSETERQVAMKILEDRIRERRLREVSTELFRKLQSNAKVVNVYNDPELRKKMPRVAATINGKQISIEELATQCLGRYGHEVLEGEINRMVLTQAMKRRSLQVSNADIDGEIRRAAVAYGYGKPDGSVEIDGWLERVQKESGSSVELYVRDVVWPTCALKKLVEAGVQLTEEDIQTGFEAHYGERVEVLAVVLSNQRTANEVYNMARSNPTDQFFGELAQQYSIEPMSKANFGQVPPISRHGGQPLLEQEAFKLKPGELSGILAIGDHFVVLRCLGRTKPVVDKLSDVRDELVADLRERKLRAAMDKEFASLKESAQVDNFVAGTLNVPRSSQVAPVNFEATDQQRSKAVRPIGTSSQRR